MTSFFQIVEPLSIKGFRGKLEDDIFFIPFNLSLNERWWLFRNIVLLILIILKMTSFLQVAEPFPIKGFGGKLKDDIFFQLKFQDNNLYKNHIFIQESC